MGPTVPPVERGAVPVEVPMKSNLDTGEQGSNSKERVLRNS